jgi:ribosomal protein S18 acetylase RimI-like enzyme
MQTIKLNEDDIFKITDLFKFLNKLPNHGFKDFSKDEKSFKNDILYLLKNKKNRIFLEYKNNQIKNYILIKNEDLINRSIIMTYDHRKIKDNIKNIKKFSKSNSIEIAIRESEKNQIKDFSLFKKNHTYEFMKMESKKFSKIINHNISINLEELIYENHYEKLVKIQNDCFVDHYGYEHNSLSDFKSEIINLEKNQIKSFFEISKNLDNEWTGYTWTQHNLKNSEGRLSMCGVIKEFRNKGLAKDLIISSIIKLIRKKCDQIYLEVDSDNIPAKKIYKDIGFEIYNKLTWHKINY